MIIDEKIKQLSLIYYFIPFSTDIDVSYNETITIDDNFVLEKENLKVRNLVRTDVKRCIENMDRYVLKESKENKFELRSYYYVRDKDNKMTGEVRLTNLSSALILQDINIYRFDNSSQFIVLKCSFSKSNPSEEQLDMEQVIRVHSHFFNNYFRETRDDLIVRNDAAPFDIANSNESFDGFVTMFVNGKEYSFGRGNRQLTSVSGFKFDFHNYQMQFVSQFLLIGSNDQDRLSYAERIANANKQAVAFDIEDKVYRTKKLISCFSGFGSSIIYFVDKPKDGALDIDFIEKENRRNVRTFYRELLNDFIIAINYRNHIKKQIIRIGDINYYENDETKYLKIREEIMNYYKESFLYYFENVSSFNYINEWYRKLLEELGVVSLYEELESKLKDAHTYIDYKVQEQKDFKERLVAKIAFIFSTIVGTVLAVFSYIQVVSQIEHYDKRIGFIIGGSIIIVVAAIIGCLVILYLQKNAQVGKTKKEKNK